MSVPRTAFIQLTGRIRVVGPAGTLEAGELPGRQARLVLASLAVTDHPVPREVLAGRLWGDPLPKAWARDLPVVVSRLRALLARIGWPDPPYITSDDSSYQLSVPSAVEVDVRTAHRSLAAATAALGRGRSGEALTSAREAAAISARPFLPGEDGDWIEEVRAELARLRLRSLEVVADAAAAHESPAEAVQAVEELLRLEPFRETAHRRLMQLHLAGGDRAAAVLVYERVRELLADELGVDPAPETEQLYLQALRATEPAPAPGGRAAARRPGPTPPVRYARSGRTSVAYQVLGDGPVDLVFVPGMLSNLELAWQEPRMAGFLRRLADASRLILFDKRGTGLSDPIPLDQPPSLETRMDDVRAVMDAADSETAVVLGVSEGGVMSTLFAATHPDRTSGLVLLGSWARQFPTEDYPWGWTPEQGARRFVRPLREHGLVPPRWFAASVAEDPEFAEWYGRFWRQSASPGMAMALLRANTVMDVRGVLPTIRVPTLVLHRTDDVLVPVEHGRYLADHIPGARLTEFPGQDHWPWIGDTEGILAEITGFLRRPLEPAAGARRLLATVVAADLPAHLPVATAVAAHRGTLAAAQGHTLARFDGAARAVECALRLVREGAPDGRVGVHTGEIEVHGDRLTGLAVDLAREVADRARPGEVLVTRTVTDLVAGTPLQFDPRGAHRLRAVGRDWELAAAR